MRVLHVFNYGWPYIDGYTVRSMGLVMAQQRHLGLETCTVTSPFPPFEKTTDRSFQTSAWGPTEQTHADVPSHLIQAFERPSVGLAPYTATRFERELGELVERFRPDLLHAHHPHYVGRAAQNVARRHDLPFVYELRCFNGDYDLSRRRPRYLTPYYQVRGRHRNAMERRLCKQADAVVTISDGLARRITASGTPAERVFVVRNSVDTALFSAHDEGPDSRRDGSLHVGYATSFSEIENLDLIVRSVTSIRETLLADHGCDLHVTLAGDGDDWNRIARLIKERGLQDRVALPGFIPYGQMPGFYRSLDLFIVPRGEAPVTRDTTPLKPLEALACGTPVLATDLPASRELLGDQPGTRFFEATPDALVREISRFADSPWRADASAQGRSWEHEVKNYEFVYDHAFSNPARGTSAA